MNQDKRSGDMVLLKTTLHDPVDLGIRDACDARPTLEGMTGGVMDG